VVLSDLKHTVAYVTIKEWRKALLRKVRLAQYLGEAHECPICGARLRRFKPIWKSFLRKTAEAGYVHPLTAVETFNFTAYSCPACDASDRERLFALFFDGVFQSLDHGRSYRFIEFAPSRGLRRRFKRYPFIEHRSADLYRKTVDDHVDITNMTIYSDSSIDFFLCSHVLEHVPDDRKALRELRRVLAPDGLGVIMVPLIRGIEDTQEDGSIDTPELRWKYYMDADHRRQYGRRDFIDRMTQAGFTVEQVTASHFPPGAFGRAGIAEDSILYVVRKSVDLALNASAGAATATAPGVLAPSPRSRW
jgi:predicted SAM-dependent methyltransferase